MIVGIHIKIDVLTISFGFYIVCSKKTIECNIYVCFIYFFILLNSIS